MDARSLHDFDDRIESFTSDWEASAHRRPHPDIRLAMTHHLVTELYRVHRAGTMGAFGMPPGPDRIGRFRTIRALVKHCGYYFLWIVKWLIVFPFDNKRKVILASFMPDRKLSGAYLHILRAWAGVEEASIVHFSIVYDMRSVFSRDVFCYPHAIHRSLPPWETREYALCEKEYRELAQKYFPSSVLPTEMRPLWKSYARMSVSFDRLIRSLQKKKRVLCCVQDIDNFAERIIFALRSRSLSIPAVSFMHSIPLYHHLLKTVYSDVAFVWGEQQRKRIEELSPFHPRRIVVAGRPALAGSRKTSAPSDRRLWLYIMQAYSRPLQDRSTRTPTHTAAMIEEIDRRRREAAPDSVLLVKPHPSDRGVKLPGTMNIFSGNVESILPAVDIIVTEDPTLALELLTSAIPLVYVADAAGAVHIDYEQWGAGQHLRSPELAKPVIETALSAPVSKECRQKMHEYYFGNPISLSRYSELFHEIIVDH